MIAIIFWSEYTPTHSRHISDTAHSLNLVNKPWAPLATQCALVSKIAGETIQFTSESIGEWSDVHMLEGMKLNGQLGNDAAIKPRLILHYMEPDDFDPEWHPTGADRQRLTGPIEVWICIIELQLYQVWQLWDDLSKPYRWRCCDNLEAGNVTEEPRVMVHDAASVPLPFFKNFPYCLLTPAWSQCIALSRHQAQVDCQVRAVPRRAPLLESFVCRLGQGVRPVPEDCSIDNVFAVDTLPVRKQ